MELRNLHILAGRFFPVLHEYMIVVGIEFFCRIVRHVDESIVFVFDFLFRRTAENAERSGKKKSGRESRLDKIVFHVSPFNENRGLDFFTNENDSNFFSTNISFDG